jgi:hypothetical protein
MTLIGPEDIVFLAAQVLTGSRLTGLTATGVLHMESLSVEVSVVKEAFSLFSLILCLKA